MRVQSKPHMLQKLRTFVLSIAYIIIILEPGNNCNVFIKKYAVDFTGKFLTY